MVQLVKSNREMETIQVPRGIAQARYHSRCMALMWWLISIWNDDEQGWSTINDEVYFDKITTDPYTRPEARTSLVDNGYVQTLPYRPGERSTRYGLQDHPDELVPFKVPIDIIERCWPFSTQDEEACLWYRQNLDLVERIQGKEQAEFADSEHGRRQDLYMIKTLEKKKGSIHRGGLNVKTGLHLNRIYSPFTNCSRRIRPLFSLAGEEMVCLDLRASQVALLAARYADEKLLADCRYDRFYGGLFEFLKDKDVFRGYDPDKKTRWGKRKRKSRKLNKPKEPFVPKERDDIKKPFFAWYFGENPSKFARKFRKAIDGWMNDNYPVTTQGVAKEKSGKEDGNVHLALELQNIEAAAFCDGAYLDLKRLGIPALLVHDAVYVGRSNTSKTEEVIDHHLKKIPGLTTYHLKKSPDYGT